VLRTRGEVGTEKKLGGQKKKKIIGRGNLLARRDPKHAGAQTYPRHLSEKRHEPGEGLGRQGGVDLLVLFRELFLEIHSEGDKKGERTGLRGEHSVEIGPRLWGGEIFVTFVDGRKGH